MKQLPNTPKGVNFSDAPQRSDEVDSSAATVGRVRLVNSVAELSVTVSQTKTVECRPLKLGLTKR